MKLSLITLVLFLFYITTAYADEIRAIDGDTIIFDGERIRLWGIDTPELGYSLKRL